MSFAIGPIKEAKRAMIMIIIMIGIINLKPRIIYFNPSFTLLGIPTHAKKKNTIPMPKTKDRGSRTFPIGTAPVIPGIVIWTPFIPSIDKTSNIPAGAPSTLISAETLYQGLNKPIIASINPTKNMIFPILFKFKPSM